MNTKTRPTFFFRKFLIIPKFQWSLIVYFLFIFIQILSIFSYALYLIHTGLSASSGYLETYRVALPFLYITIFWTMIFVILTVVIGGVLISHRAAGPIFRIHEVIKQLLDSPLEEKISFRKDDFFPEIEKDLNLLNEKMKSLNK